MAQKLDCVGDRKNVKSMVRYLSAALDAGFGGAGERAADATPNSPRTERLKRVQAAIKSRSPTQRHVDKRLFLNGLTDAGDRADFERFGWMSPVNAQAVFRFWEDMDPELFEGVA